jgi:hypothetical protein
VHKHLYLPPLAAKFYDTRQFQRLSDLKQLGLTYQVFRGASHNRCPPALRRDVTMDCLPAARPVRLSRLESPQVTL